MCASAKIKQTIIEFLLFFIPKRKLVERRKLVKNEKTNLITPYSTRKFYRDVVHTYTLTMASRVDWLTVDFVSVTSVCNLQLSYALIVCQFLFAWLFTKSCLLYTIIQISITFLRHDIMSSIFRRVSGADAVEKFFHPQILCIWLH